jgi:hypothetical protein
MAMTPRQREYYLDGLSIYTDTLPMPTQIIDGRLCGIGLSRLKLNRSIKVRGDYTHKRRVARTCIVCGQTTMVVQSSHVPKRCRWCANGATGLARIKRNQAVGRDA